VQDGYLGEFVFSLFHDAASGHLRFVDVVFHIQSALNLAA
jgi:hypothetical protein